MEIRSAVEEEPSSARRPSAGAWPDKISRAAHIVSRRTQPRFFELRMPVAGRSAYLDRVAACRRTPYAVVVHGHGEERVRSRRPACRRIGPHAGADLREVADEAQRTIRVAAEAVEHNAGDGAVGV